MDVHDEEITSDEEIDPAKEERKMLTVALVKSVVETKQQDSSGDEKRYGLRKRRRPTGEDLRLLEHNQSSTDGGLARKAQAAGMVNDPLSPQGDSRPMETEITGEEKPNILLPAPNPTLHTTPGAPVFHVKHSDRLLVRGSGSSRRPYLRVPP